MRILYLIYKQHSFPEFSRTGITNISWVDALIHEIGKSHNTSIALALPINENSLLKAEKDGIQLFGLPYPRENTVFKKVLRKLVNNPDSSALNPYILKVINDFNPDIIQIFGSENPLGSIISQTKVPVIIHIQGYLMVWKGKWFTSITKCEQLKYESLKSLILRQGSYHEFNTFAKRASRESVILKNCKYFMGRTSFDKRIASLLSPGSKYFHCDEFIRREFFETHWNYSFKKEITCVSILKGTSYKGIDLLIEALVILKQYSDHIIKVKICGVSESEEIVHVIKRKYKKVIGLIQIEFLGKLETNELVQQLCSANLYIHPSFIENSPNSVCEAMALGMPIISTNVGGINTLINDREEGLLVQEGEPYSLAAAILELINNYEYAVTLGKNARLKSIARHEPQKIAKQLLDIYNSILLENDR